MLYFQRHEILKVAIRNNQYSKASSHLFINWICVCVEFCLSFQRLTLTQKAQVNTVLMRQLWGFHKLMARLKFLTEIEGPLYPTPTMFGDYFMLYLFYLVLLIIFHDTGVGYIIVYNEHCPSFYIRWMISRIIYIPITH